MYKNKNRQLHGQKNVTEFIFRCIRLPELTESMAKELDKPIEEWEIKQVISTVGNYKSRGPDG